MSGKSDVEIEQQKDSHYSVLRLTENWKKKGLMNISTAGASARTASQDGLPAGVGSSEAMARRDGQFIEQYRGIIASVGRECGIDPAIIAGIISRETRGGTAISGSGGWGDNGNAFGLMQIDKRWHSSLQGAWNSREHIEQAARILKMFISAPDNPFSNPDQRLKAGIAAYNMGFQRMAGNFNSIDDHTTGKDYSSDVVARAQYFKRIGY